MELDEIKRKVNIALSQLKTNDADLFNFGIRTPEREVSHKLGCYLQPLFNDLNVDCEYNRHIQNVKKNQEGNPIVPDIVIHHRKDDSNNLLVIEIKTNDDKEEIKKDINKLVLFTSKNGDFGYDYGLYMYFKAPEPSIISWFKDGHEI